MSTLNLAAVPLQNPIEEHQSPASGELSFAAASPAMRTLLDRIAIVAPYLRIAALEGESGTGKNTLVRLLYQRYAVRHSEMRQWGLTRCDARDWLLSQTDPQSLKGFIFLERVDLLAAPGQALLLRLLKDLDFCGSGTLVVLASSESSLRELGRKGQFLPELAIRLTTVRLAVPPLRERKEDIVPLVNVLLNQISARYHQPSVVLTPGAIARLHEYQWPGNIRELSGVLESAVIECSNGIIDAQDLALPAAQIAAPLPIRTPDLLNLDAVIHDHILRVLNSNNGNKLRTARQLGISRSTLYRLLEKRLTFAA